MRHEKKFNPLFRVWTKITHPLGAQKVPPPILNGRSLTSIIDTNYVNQQVRMMPFLSISQEVFYCWVLVYQWQMWALKCQPLDYWPHAIQTELSMQHKLFRKRLTCLRFVLFEDIHPSTCQTVSSETSLYCQSPCLKSTMINIYYSLLSLRGCTPLMRKDNMIDLNCQAPST